VNQEFERDGPTFNGIVTNIVEQLGQLGRQPIPDKLSFIAGPFLGTSDETTDELPHRSGLVSVVYLRSVHLGKVAINDGPNEVKDLWPKELG
jgi:hypothetical protein